MNIEKKAKMLLCLLQEYQELGIAQQIDYQKFYLYSIITHSTAIEGSTVTEIENQLLFDEGISAPGRNIQEQLMNLDLKAAYAAGCCSGALVLTGHGGEQTPEPLEKPYLIAENILDAVQKLLADAQ